MKKIEDAFGRSFKTLRISLTSKCNLGCIYCTTGTAEENLQEGVHEASLNTDDLNAIVTRLHDVLQLQTIRLTGGEPLLYRGLEKIVEHARSLGIADIRMTTNAYLLERKARMLADAGLRSINVSLDAVTHEHFFLMTRRSNLDAVFKGIDAALEAGINVKINSVIMRGINQNQVLPLLKYGIQKRIPIRFLEVMAMGHLYHKAAELLYLEKEILEQVQTEFSITPLPREASATANYWQMHDGYRFGIIANESHPFCSDCNRLRLDSHGNLYGCLSSNHPVPIVGVTDPVALEQKLQMALADKQAVRFTGSNLSMIDIGG
jgi:GTP 3',8-cyclase